MTFVNVFAFAGREMIPRLPVIDGGDQRAGGILAIQSALRFLEQDYWTPYTTFERIFVSVVRVR
jgi:hypothetical protein